VLNIARIVLFVFAAVLIVGGIAGYVKTQSVPSLAAGIVCGGLGLAAGILLPTKPQLALILGIVGAVLAAGGMIPRLKKAENKLWPSGTVVAASVVTLVVSIAALATSKGSVPPAQ
jgi:uncharacterized membrane protein (UPF0136 family)